VGKGGGGGDKARHTIYLGKSSEGKNPNVGTYEFKDGPECGNRLRETILRVNSNTK